MTTYEFEEAIKEAINTDTSSADYMNKLGPVLDEAVELKINYESILDAISQTVTEEQAHQIVDLTKKIADEYNWRYIDADAKKKINDYGYYKPVVVVEEEEAAEYLDNGKNILLLRKDNTETVSNNEREIKSFLLQGGLIAVPQLYVDEDLENIANGDK